MSTKGEDLSLPTLNGYYALQPGKLATLTTYFERLGPFSFTAEQWPEGVSYKQFTASDTQHYRSLFRAVGENLLWESRLYIEEDELIEVLSDPDVEALVILKNDRAVGLLEINFKQKGEAEIVYIGLIPEATGSGIGHSMMTLALNRAATRQVDRLWLHTCHFDSEQAPRFYEKHGFRAYRLAIEIMDDPRITGKLPKEAAPHIPLILID